MTQSGNINIHSENSTTKIDIIDPMLEQCNLTLHYMLLQKEGSIHLVSPINGYLNVLLLKNNVNSICPYFVNQNSYVIRGGENVIQPISKGDIFDWKNFYAHNIGLIIFIPNTFTEDFNNKLQHNNTRFKDLLLTSSDNRMQLLQARMLELHQQPSLLNQLKIQSNLIEIIAHQIEGLMVENENNHLIAVKNQYDKIVLAKKMIDSDISRNYTIAELAREVGTNEQYLKKYFKEYFGKTVSNYITERKMNYAKELIISGEYRVADVARMAGYKHSTHFTTAFKKYFGFIPNSLRYTFLIAQGVGQVIIQMDYLTNIL